MARIHEGRHVRIRPLREDDLPVVRAWRQDSRALAGFNAPAIRSACQERAAWSEHQFRASGDSMYAIETLAGDRLVGKVGFSRDSPVHGPMVRTISIVGDPADRGQGFATEATE